MRLCVKLHQQATGVKLISRLQLSTLQLLSSYIFVFERCNNNHSLHIQLATHYTHAAYLHNNNNNDHPLATLFVLSSETNTHLQQLA